MKRFILALLLFTTWAAGAVNVQISGIVKNTDNIPQQNVFVLAYVDGDSTNVATASTDAQGYYQIDIEYIGGGTPSHFGAIVVDGCSSYQLFGILNASGGSYSANVDFWVNPCIPGSGCEIWNIDIDQQPGNLFGFDVSAYDNADPAATFTYVWDFGDGTPTATGNPVEHTYAQNGPYLVVVEATSSTGCVTNTSLWVTAEPQRIIQVSGTLERTNGEPVPFYAVEVYSDSDWTTTTTDQNGQYSTSINAPLDATAISASVFDFCTPFGFFSKSTLIVNESAQIDFTICDSFPFPPQCGNEIVYDQSAPYSFEFWPFDYSFTGAQAVSNHWDLGDGTTYAGIGGLSHTYAIPGIYNVALTTVFDDSCTAYTTTPIFAFGDSIWCPIDTFYGGCQAMFWPNYYPDSAGQNSTLTTIQFIDASFGTVVEWEWNFGDGNTSNQGPNVTHTYAQPGLYKVELRIMTIDGCESTIGMEVYAGNFAWVEPDCQALFLPLPDSSGLGYFFLDLSSTLTPVTGWNWNFGDGNTSTEQFPFHTYAQGGVYEVTLTIESDSCNSIFSTTLDTDNPFNGIKENSGLGLSSVVSSTGEQPNNDLVQNLRAFPNPVQGDLQVQWDSKTTGTTQVNLSNSLGQTVRQLQWTAQTGTNNLRMPCAGLPSGLYTLSIGTEKGVQSLRVMVAE
jgi:PKD repeat protein